MSSQSLIKPAARVLFVTAAILMIPFLAMRSGVGGWNWTGFDFVFAAFLFGGTVTMFEVVMRKAHNAKYRVASVLAILCVLGLIWVNGAVGIIGNEGNPANLMFLGVIAVEIIGALLARFKTRGMSRTMFASAAAAAVVIAIALATNQHQGDTHNALEIVGATGMFIVLYVAAGILYRHSDR